MEDVLLSNEPMNTILEQIREDYGQFPHHQRYELYAPNVYFKDPMTEFRGVTRYQRMIGFMGRWFQDMELQLHAITQTDNDIYTEWVLRWTSPLPWRPRITIAGKSKLQLDENGLIIAHIDHWYCSRLDVLRQHFLTNATSYGKTEPRELN